MSIITICVFIVGLVFGLGNVLGNKVFLDSEKPSSFECGFYSVSNKWAPFSMSFFLSATIFLIFDVELVLIFPYLISQGLAVNVFSGFSVIVFLLLLSIGFFFEWSQNFLEWNS